MDTITCKNCGSDIVQNYCPNCGEKRFNKSQLSLRHFVGEIFEGLTHFDSKFLRTIKTLIIKPGQLSLDYSEGIKMRYMRPIQVFLVTNLIFFFLIARNLYSLSLQNYITYRPFTDYNTKEIISNKLKHASLNLSEYQELFNERMKENSKEFIFLFVPLYAALFALLFFFGKKKFVENIVFSTHFICFVLLFFLAETYLVSFPYAKIAGVGYSQNFDTFVQLLTMAALSVYLFIAFRKFYRSSVVWSIIASLVIALTFFEFIQYYRMLLFYKIVYWG